MRQCVSFVFIYLPVHLRVCAYYMCVLLSLSYSCHGSFMELAAQDFSAGLQTGSPCDTSLFGPSPLLHHSYRYTLPLSIDVVCLISGPHISTEPSPKPLAAL